MSSELPLFVQSLLMPEAYPERPSTIELLQTQMSFIFLTGDYTYKIKKPVNLGYLDYTSLDKRLYFCRQEMELNRRLCPKAYLGVLPVTESKGKIRIGGSGSIIEYAVKMRQLPRERMMDILLTQDQVTAEMVRQVALKMAEFHSLARTDAAISAFGNLEMIKTNTDENFSQTEKYIDVAIGDHSFNKIKQYTDGFISDNVKLFNERVAGGKIKDCHGDLHAAHVCFSDDIYIYDCIEFNDRFRYCDTSSEIAFLAMDLDRYGRADLARAFVDAYIDASHDKKAADLMCFYKCYRAYVRGKVACFKYDDPYLTEKDNILSEAKLYFNLANMYTRNKPALLIVTGLIGSGKTTIAEMIGRGLDFITLSSDAIRKELANVPLKERHYDSFGGGIYSPEFTQRTYNELLGRARKLLDKGKSVILDASFKKKADRLAAFKLAKEAGADFLAIECIADENVIRQRLENRQKEGSISDGRWEIFADIKKDFEAVDEFPAVNHLLLDTGNLSGNTISLILERMARL